MTESDLENGFHVSHTAIRKDEVLSNREKQFLVSVERGDMATARTYLEVSEVTIYMIIYLNVIFII